MPFCQISADVTLHYIVSTPSGDIADLDASKATIIVLPYLFTDLTWLREQFGDERLTSEYNLLAFDQRNMGKTRSPAACPKRDTWVDAADIALAHELLQLPPCHFLGLGMNGSGAALRLAMLFPTKCLSLGLNALPTQAGDDPEWVPQGYLDVMEIWCYPKDLEMVERAHLEMLWFVINGQATPALEDELTGWWCKNLAPRNRSNFFSQAMCAVLRPPYADRELQSVTHPTLIIQGDQSRPNPPEKSQATASRLPNATLFVLKGGPEFAGVVPQYASVMHRTYLQFLQRLHTPVNPGAKPSAPDPRGVMQAGLKRLAAFANDPSVATRDPTTTLSFCQYSTEQLKQNEKDFARLAAGEKEAFSPLDENGQPIRKISERHAGEWAPPAFERMKQSLSSMVTVSKTETFSDMKGESVVKL